MVDAISSEIMQWFSPVVLEARNREVAWHMCEADHLRRMSVSECMRTLPILFSGPSGERSGAPHPDYETALYVAVRSSEHVGASVADLTITDVGFRPTKNNYYTITVFVKDDERSVRVWEEYGVCMTGWWKEHKMQQNR